MDLGQVTDRSSTWSFVGRRGFSGVVILVVSSVGSLLVIFGGFSPVFSTASIGGIGVNVHTWTMSYPILMNF